MGKTLLGQLVAKKFSRNNYVAYIPQPCPGDFALLNQIATELGAEKFSELSIEGAIQNLDRVVKKAGVENKRVMVIIDEVQSLTSEALQMIRFITNLQAHGESLIQVVLFAQPELDEILEQKRFRQLKQCISHHFFSQPIK